MEGWYLRLICFMIGFMITVNVGLLMMQAQDYSTYSIIIV